MIVKILSIVGFAVCAIEGTSWLNRPSYWWNYNYTSMDECSPLPFCSRFERARHFIKSVSNTSYLYERILFKRSYERSCQLELKPRDVPVMASSVNITLYYESPCTDCKEIFVNKSDPTYLDLVSKNKLNLQVVRLRNGKALEVDDKWLQQCQHVKAKCLSNRVEACALRYTPRKLRVPYMACLISYGPTVVNAKYCSSVYNLSWQPIQNCLNVPGRVQKMMGELNFGLKPSHIVDPLFTLNANHNGLNTNMLGFVCNYYKNEKPAVCNLRTIQGVVFKTGESFIY